LDIFDISAAKVRNPIARESRLMNAFLGVSYLNTEQKMLELIN
jgi:hypothetical protein